MEEFVYQCIGDKLIKIKPKEFTITWENEGGGIGRLVLQGEFFPCTRKQSRELKLLITSEQQKEILEYLEYAKGVYDYYFKKFAGEYNHLTSMRSDLRPTVESGKFASGIPLTKEELKEHKQKLQRCLGEIREVIDTLNKLKTKIEKCNQNLKDLA